MEASDLQPRLHGSPGPPTMASPLLYQPGLLGRRAWQGQPSASSLGSFLLPAETCPGWERRVPGSNPDAGPAPAWSTRGQSQRGLILGSVATSPRLELLALVAPPKAWVVAALRPSLAPSTGLTPH